MDRLPFEVVYGAWIWRAALLLFLGGGLALAWWRPRRAARAAWRATREHAGRPSSPVDRSDGERITIAGRLEAEGAAAERFEDGGEAAAASAGSAEQVLASKRAERLALVTDDGRIELEGDVEVLVGAEESWSGKPCRRLPAATKERLGEAFLRDAPVVCRSFRGGERALASGVLRLAAATEGTGYREPGRRFVLEAATLVAGDPPRVRGPARSRAVGGTLFAGLLFLAVFGLGGVMLDKVSEEEHASEVKPLPELLGHYRATSLLAATPFHRDDALSRLRHAVSRRGTPSLEVREGLVALSDLRGDCAGAMRTLLQHRAFDRVRERGARCKGGEADRLAAVAAFAHGDLAEASRSLRGRLAAPGSPDDHGEAIRIHLLAGDLAEAAAAADRAAGWLRGDQDWLSDGKEAAAHREELAKRFECVGAALRAREGEGEARARLEGLAAETGAVECRLLLADLATGSAREELLGDLGEIPFELESVPGLLRAESALPEAAGELDLRPVDLASNLRGIGFVQARLFGFGLEAAVFEGLAARDDLSPAAAALRRRLAERAIAAESAVGRFDEARQLVDGFALEADEDPIGPDRAALRAFVELRAGDLDAAREVLAAAESPGDRDRREMAEFVRALERGELPAHFTGSVLSAEALSAALGGDGARLAEEIRENYYHSLLQRLSPLAAWLPDEVLADCLKSCRPNGNELRYRLREALAHLGDLARVAEAAGEAEMARDLRKGARRVREASLRREIAVPLAVVDSF